MRSVLWRFNGVLTSALLVTALAVPLTLTAQTAQHLVSPSELQKAAVNASQSRQQNIAKLNGFLSSVQAQKALESAHMSPQEVQKAVAGLSDQELAQLAARASKTQSSFAAGEIGNHDLLLILVGIAALILIIVAVR